jgi:hypothetical protein
MAYTMASYDDVKQYLKTCSTKRLYVVQDELFKIIRNRENTNFTKALKAAQSKKMVYKQHA